ncbi:MAG: Na/Pi symporter [Candidatus Latescibacterota bacterium]|nr:MAG: Na/Pi symporter [Candidatus Latescibacterota bacterium]
MFLEGRARIIRNRVINPPPIVRLILLLSLLYAFFVSISLMGASFKFFGKGFAQQLLTTTSNPFTGLFIGILATSLVQSSSTITSMVVGLVAGGALTVSGAIPIVIGSNIGTSVTNTLVSIGHISRPKEFRRAFAAATIHDFFNLIAVVILFPLQLLTNFLGDASAFMATQFANAGGMKLLNPLKMIVSPAVKFITLTTHESGVLMLIISVILLFIALRFIVVNLRALVIGKVEQFFDKTLFKNSLRAMLLGVGLTVMVQSSSITTSLCVPLAGARILTLKQIFPFALGANVGTTITAMLASLVTADPAAVTVAFAHLLFNVTGIIIIWPMRRLPIHLSERLASASIRSRFVPVLYILIVFFLIPIALISLTR